VKLKSAVLIVSLFFAVFSASKYEPDLRFVDHVVADGETLWNIADKSDLDIDKRDIIAYMVDHSGIDEAGNIHPGMIVKVPMMDK
jgi:hypothetical protein